MTETAVTKRNVTVQFTDGSDITKVVAADTVIELNGFRDIDGSGVVLNPAFVAAVLIGDIFTEGAAVLTSVDSDKKIQTIKEVRAVTGLGLYDAKSLVDAVSSGDRRPLRVCSPAEFKELRKAFMSVNATVELEGA